MVRILLFLTISTLVLVGGIAWLGYRALGIKADLESASALLPVLKQQIEESDVTAAGVTVNKLQAHTSAARDSAGDPLWTIASAIPWIGSNMSAVAEVARSADDVTRLGLVPLVQIYDSLDWKSLLPTSETTNLGPIESAAPKLSASSYAIRASYDRLDRIETSELLPQVSAPLTEVKVELNRAKEALAIAADIADIAPRMLGVDQERNYLLIVQNNAEARASGGIPGALAILKLKDGKLSLGDQSSATELGTMSPTLPLDDEQQQIFTTRLGKYMQDVNLTPDFPTAAANAHLMWKQKTGQRVDGVISIDPVALSYLLAATGPVSLDSPEFSSLRTTGLPTKLTQSNVVTTLLSDVYSKIRSPDLQDAYFAAVAKETFSAFSTSATDSKALLSGVVRGAEEGRVLLWSSNEQEQSTIAKYSLSGSISGPSVTPAQFGVYFNDGTGAKMDFYVKRQVQLVEQCPKDGYLQISVRIASTNTAPADASSVLPAYVTGNGVFGVPPGTVQTNIVVYGPVQAYVESAYIDEQKSPFAPYHHENRPVGVISQQLKPGESKTVEFTFGKIVQHTEPNLVVTPSVEAIQDVVSPTEKVTCRGS